MNHTPNYSKELLTILASEHMETLFYFCLKKTGNTAEAEDLTSDIMINVINQLHRGNIPEHFSPWIWKIAKNRYSRWADRKNKNAKSVITNTDLTEITSPNNTTEEQFLHSEDLELLRRELAFISKDYREIVVAYYIDDYKVQDIAKNLAFPEGTVKTKLFRARKKLKEGMNMARKFGIRSYKPENVNFAASGYQPTKLPWEAVQRSIPKNILLQAHNNPSTIEELALELGIAAPYMEEEINILTNSTLLQQTENQKYVTNFFIAAKECQKTIYEILHLTSKERSEITDQIITESFPQIKKLNLMHNNMSDEDFKWLLIIYFCDQIIKAITGYSITNPVKRTDGGKWGFIGYEEVDLPQNLVMGHNGHGADNIAMVWTYKIGNYYLWDRAGEMNRDQVLLLHDMIKNKRNISTLTDLEQKHWQEIAGRFAHQDSAGNVIPDIAVFTKATHNEFIKITKQHQHYPKLLQMYQKTFDEIITILKSNSNPVLYNQLNYCASMFILDARMMVVHDLVQTQKLIVPDQPEKSTIAMYMELK